LIGDCTLLVQSITLFQLKCQKLCRHRLHRNQKVFKPPQAAVYRVFVFVVNIAVKLSGSKFAQIERQQIEGDIVGFIALYFAFYFAVRIRMQQRKNDKIRYSLPKLLHK